MQEQHEEMTQRDTQKFEAEQMALGAALIDQNAADTVIEQLTTDVLEKQHKPILKAMRMLSEKGDAIDLVSVTFQLRDNGDFEKVGGTEYLAMISGSVPTAASVDFYVERVIEKYRERQAFAALQEQATALAEGETVDDVIEQTERRLSEIKASKKQNSFTPIKDIMLANFDQIESRAGAKQQGSAVPGIPSGYHDLDAMTSGFQRSDLIILAARPAVGKTAFALNVAQNIAVRVGETVAIFSLEMSKEQLGMRMLCAEARVDASKLKTGFIEEDDWPKLTMAVGTLSEAPIFVDDTPGITVHDIRAKCRKLQAEHGLGLILIDYLQLIQGRGANRQEAVSEISRMLKLIARELNVPVIALSQLSRSVEQRQDKRPMMSDLRESGSIEQDADIVSFLFREDYYQPESERKNIVELIIGKHRNGPTGTVELVFLKNFNKFVNLERAPGA